MEFPGPRDAIGNNRYDNTTEVGMLHSKFECFQDEVFHLFYKRKINSCFGNLFVASLFEKGEQTDVMSSHSTSMTTQRDTSRHIETH